jgi:DNA-binding response OmpR family regulator
MDQELGFVRVLNNRLQSMGWEWRTLAAAVPADELLAMRLQGIVLDPAILGADAWAYLTVLRERTAGLVIIVNTGPSTLAQRVHGLRLGVDAWLTKPSHPAELVATIQSALRRQLSALAVTTSVEGQHGELTLRPELSQAFVGVRSLDLTLREFEVLRHMVLHAGRVLSRESIYEDVWGYGLAHGDRSVDEFVRRLRRKLRYASPDWEYIHTQFGAGYRFEAQQRGPAPPLSEIDVGAHTL